MSENIEPQPSKKVRNLGDEITLSYSITDETGYEQITNDRELATKRLEQSFFVREIKKYVTYTEDSVVTLTISSDIRG